MRVTVRGSCYAYAHPDVTLMQLDIFPAHPNIIVCIHGLGRHRFDMKPLEWRLKRHFPQSTVLNFGYRSRYETIEEHATRLLTFLNQSVAPGSRLHFVCHSLGSIVLRASAERLSTAFSLGRVVMLGPPNQGSALAKALLPFGVFRKILGPSLPELANLSIPLATDLFEIGVIAGGTGARFGFLPLLKGDNDGVVRVEETTLPGMRAHLQVRVTHPMLIMRSKVARLAALFLERGSFQPAVFPTPEIMSL